jgi:hypothetical protein
MKQHLYYWGLFVIFFTKIHFLPAQITYQAADYGAAGDTFLLSYVTDSLSNINFSTTGANQTWDFSRLRVSTQAREAFLGDTGYFPSFLLSCLATGGGFQCFGDWGQLVDFGVTDFNGFNVLDFGVSNVVRHQKKQDNVLREGLLGLTIQTGGLSTPLTIRYTNPDTVLRFPLRYQNRHSDYSEWTFDLRFANVDVVYKHTQTRTYVVDGWGALTTPAQTYASTLRVRTEILSKDTIFAYGNTIPTQTRTVNLAWFANNTKRPVMEVFGAALDSASQPFVPLRVAFVDAPRCLAPDLSFVPIPPVAVLNPGDSLTVNFLSAAQNVNQFYWNFGDGTPTVQTSSGNPRHIYRAPGTYTITAVGCAPNCTPARCDTFAFTLFVSAAPTTSVEEADVNANQFRVYPNPVASLLQVESIRAEFPIQQVVVFDMLGKRLLQQQFTVATLRTELDVAAFPPGMYVVQVHSSKGQVGIYKILKQ